MNILHIVPYYAPAYAFGGVVRAVEGLALAQVSQGHNVTVLTTDALTPTSRVRTALHEIRDGVRLIRVPNVLPLLRLWNLSSPLLLSAALRDLKPDVIHGHEFRTLENVLALPTMRKIPTVLSPHGTLNLATGRGGLKAAWDRFISPSVAGAIRGIIALTQQEQTEIDSVWRTFAPTVPPIHIVPNGVDVDQFAHLPDPASLRKHYRIAPHETVILFLGRLHKRKGVEVLVKAFERAKLKDAWLMLAGPDEGMMETLAGIAGKRVLFMGHLDGHKRLQALSGADVFVLPAVGEGLSMAVLEALASGIPVILSPGCNLPETETLGAGLIVSPEIGPLTEALTTLVNDPALRANMSRNAQLWAQESFSWSKIADQMETVYQGVL